MDFKNIRWPIVAAILVGTMAVLGVGQLVYRMQTVDRPLKAFLASTPEVKSFDVQKNAEGTTINMKLGPLSDLRTTYTSIAKGLAKVSKGPFKIVVTDDRDPALEQAYYRMHFAIQESLQRGTFTSAEDVVSREATAAQLKTARLFVDSDRVYLQLSDNDHYLYEVLSRSTPTEKATQAQAGGRSGL